MADEMQSDIDATKVELTQLAAARQFADQSGPEFMDSMGLRIAHNADRIADRPYIHFEGRDLCWSEFNSLANQYAHALHDIGVREGDVVALMMENRIEYCIILAAISKINAIVSLINYSLTRAGVAHSLKVSGATRLIFGEEVAVTVKQCHAELSDDEEMQFMHVADRGNATPPSWALCLDEKANLASTDNPPAKPYAPSDIVAYIFTSGTTGMPKAVKITNQRHMGGALAGWKMALRSNGEDRTYVGLPLYHGNGITLGFGAPILSGGSVYLKRRFSASQFLDEVRQHGITIFIYVGELCRYLMAVPEGENDADTSLSKMCGNGLRPDIWKKFKTRFGIDRICELYSASEANVNFFNALNKDETIGFPSNEVVLVEYDIEQDEIIKDQDGRCIKVAFGRPGLMLSRISESAVFSGYTDASANEKKIVRNVFEDGDAWFNSGDLLREVDVGFTGGLPHYQFVDRLGDTFRWKAENVSTTEVTEIIQDISEIEIANVYGVDVPGMEGKACMVAITLREDVLELDRKIFSAHVKQHLPAYACPIFVRICKALEMTGTFKLTKGNLRREGFDPRKIDEPLYFACENTGSYVPLDQSLFEEICDGKRRV